MFFQRIFVIWCLWLPLQANIWDNLFSNQELLKENSGNFLIKAKRAEGRRACFCGTRAIDPVTNLSF